MLPLMAFFVSVFFLIRSILIFIGLIKDPILEACEKYGPDEFLYIPLLPVMVWSGMVMLMFGAWLWSLLRIASPLLVPGLLTLLVAGFCYRYYERVAEWHNRLLKYPRWYHELRERTTRYERRRIAYAWSRLSWRLRLTYNSNSEAFQKWADFVIMSTVFEVEETTEGLYYPYY
jgi:hypothetical protein